MATEGTPALKAFELAREAFRKKLVNSRSYDHILNSTTIRDVFEATSKIQEDVAKRGQLKWLRRIEPFITRLSEYASTIEVFVSAKPELLALIWGPIKLILLWASELSQAMDAIASAMEKITQTLPRFEGLDQVFPDNEIVKQALALFFEDILDFFATILDFSQNRRSLKQNFTSLWKGPQARFNIILSNIEKHSCLLKDEVTFLDITEAKEARIQSLKHFADVRASELSRQYTNLKNGIDPPQYRDKLSWLRERSVADCDDWLFRNADFLSWRHPSAQGTKLFWLCGNPGAGKTYLSASIIGNLINSEDRVLFAFVSYTESRWVNARSIVSSLLFQAADESIDLQSVLVETPERDLHDRTGPSTLLKNFLKAASGTIYIIIDGVDEIDELEQQILLERLADMVSGCKNLRLLISSRIEHIISRTLEQKATSVRVDRMNSGSIQIYVDHRCERWMSERQFDPEVRRELRELIAPLPAKAAGMFLFARIVLDNMDWVGSIEELRDELRAPPENMDDAYHRIFERVNKAPALHRKRARNVLGWVGCAPSPLTKYEMEQALSIRVAANQKLTPASLPRPLRDDFVKLCGPIVEVVGDRVQFVHFTAQEYIFSSKIPDFIDNDAATAHLARSLLAYLGIPGMLDSELEDHEIDENILKGNYRLFEYAYLFWPFLFRKIRSTARIESLGKLLHTIIEERGTNARTQLSDEDLHSVFRDRYLEASLPEAYRVVCETLHFRLTDKREGWNRGNSHTWVEKDPLATSQILVRVHDRLEALAAQPIHQACLKSHYGDGLLRCTYPLCLESCRSFETKKEREDHMVIHGLSWKCSIQSCDFSSIGFSTKQRRDDHWMKLHLPNGDQLTTEGFDPTLLNAGEAEIVLFMLASENNVKKVQQLLAAPAGKRVKKESLSAARRIAAKSGCFVMEELLAPPGEYFKPPEIVIVAIDSGDVECAKKYIGMSNPRNAAQITGSIVSTVSEEMYIIWEEFIMAQVQRKDLTERTDFLSRLFDTPLFRAVKDKPLAERRLIRTLQQLSYHLGARRLGALLVMVAKASCSVLLAQELIALGAPVDYPSGTGRTSKTALQIAAKKTSRDAAFFMKYLIEEGAASIGKDYVEVHDPDKIAQERGAMGIAEHVGQTFEELRIQAHRKRTSADAIVID